MWFPVVKLARMWEFDRIHKYAIQNMPYEQVCKTSAEKVALAIKYDIQPWLLPGLNELAKRNEPLGNHDLELLGPEVVLKVSAVRESLTISASYGRARCGNCGAAYGTYGGAYNTYGGACGNCGGGIYGGACSNCGRACTSTNDNPGLIAGSRDVSKVDFTSVIKRVFQISG